MKISIWKKKKAEEAVDPRRVYKVTPLGKGLVRVTPKRRKMRKPKVVNE